MHSFLRVIKFAFQDIFRNLGLSLMTVFILTLMLLSLNSLWSVDILAKESVKLVRGQVNMSLFLKTNITDKDLSGLNVFLHSIPEVTSVKVLTKQEALVAFKQRYSGRAEVIAALNELGDNPFGSTLVVTANQPQDYTKINEALTNPAYASLIDSKSFDEHQDAIGKIQNITNRIEQVGFGLLVLFSVIAFFIIFNTIRVAIYTQRMEISIKRLVGAHNWFIRGPYLVSSVVFSLLSIALTVLIIFIGLRYIDSYIGLVFPNGFTLTGYYRSHWLWLFGWQTLLVLALTALSSSLAMRRQLKV